jgi:hypothetical protein
MKKYLMKTLMTMLGLLVISFIAMGADMSNGANNCYSSDQVTVQKVTFEDQYRETRRPDRKRNSTVPIPG